MEWTAIAILCVILAVGLVVFVTMSRFLEAARENKENYKKIMAKLETLAPSRPVPQADLEENKTKAISENEEDNDE